MTAHKVMYRGYEVPESLLGNLFGGLNAWKQGVDTVLEALTPCAPGCHHPGTPHSESAETSGAHPELIEVSVYGPTGCSVDNMGVWLVDDANHVWYRDFGGTINPAATPCAVLMDMVSASAGMYRCLGYTEIPLPN